MAIITVSTQITIEDDDSLRRTYPFGRTVTGLTAFQGPQKLTIAANATLTIYDATEASEHVDPWTFLFLEASGILDVEFTTNEGHGDEELATVRLVQGIPLVLGSNVSYYDHSTNNAFGGTADVIDKIKVDEPSSSAVILTMMLAK